MEGIFHFLQKVQKHDFWLTYKTLVQNSRAWLKIMTSLQSSWLLYSYIITVKKSPHTQSARLSSHSFQKWPPASYTDLGGLWQLLLSPHTQGLPGLHHGWRCTEAMWEEVDMIEYRLKWTVCWLSVTSRRTSVCTMKHLRYLIDWTNPKISTLFSASICFSCVCMVMNVPVRPTPALQRNCHCYASYQDHIVYPHFNAAGIWTTILMTIHMYYKWKVQYCYLSSMYTRLCLSVPSYY